MNGTDVRYATNDLFLTIKFMCSIIKSVKDKIKKEVKLWQN